MIPPTFEKFVLACIDFDFLRSKALSRALAEIQEILSIANFTVQFKYQEKDYDRKLAK